MTIANGCPSGAEVTGIPSVVRGIRHLADENSDGWTKAKGVGEQSSAQCRPDGCPQSTDRQSPTPQKSHTIHFSSAPSTRVQ
jgi:hypothetical protein